ncbi:uncharacterized protein CBL_06947 [Carabus blaptoides fortunei]
MGVPSEKEFTELDWIQLNKEVRQADNQETTKERMLRKIQENPFVPIGCLATFCALSYGLWSFRHGRKQMSQYMMRARIAAQGFTIIALVAGIGLTARNTISKN